MEVENPRPSHLNPEICCLVGHETLDWLGRCGPCIPHLKTNIGHKISDTPFFLPHSHSHQTNTNTSVRLLPLGLNISPAFSHISTCREMQVIDASVSLLFSFPYVSVFFSLTSSTTPRLTRVCGRRATLLSLFSNDESNLRLMPQDGPLACGAISCGYMIVISYIF